MADPRTLRNLQAYIYKRPQDRSAGQVFAHIDKVNQSERLTPANWDALLVPACTRPDPEVLRWLVDHGSRPTKQLVKLMTMTVGGQETLLPQIERRIEVLGLLLELAPEGDPEASSRALSSACWFNNIGPAAWLIQHGADIHFMSWNALRHAKVDCLTNAEMFGERFGDYTLFHYLKPWYDDETPLGDWRQFYSGREDPWTQ